MKTSLVFLAVVFSVTVSYAQNNPRNLELNWKTDTGKHSVPLNEFTALMLRDGIPPIDNPKFFSKAQGDTTFFAHEPVISVVINGEAKAYPLSILMYHEIVNDVVGGKEICVTYCPLCNAAIVFDRKVNFDGKAMLLDFGVSGMLRSSDMVMWDRQTETWWQQFTGEALVGQMNGIYLVPLASQLISYEEFYKNNPKGIVLSTDNGHDMTYGSNPYVEYDSKDNTQPRLFKGQVDERLPAMERVINIRVNEKHKVYPLATIEKLGVINDNFEGQDVVVFHQRGTVSVLDQKEISKAKDIGAVTVFNPSIEGEKLTFEKMDSAFVDQQSGSVWNITGKCVSGKLEGKQLPTMVHGNHFAFAWFAFEPECEIFEP